MKVQFQHYLNNIKEFFKNTDFKQIFKNRWLFLFIVIIPFVLIFLYYMFIASDKYVSESKITIKQTGEPKFSLSLSSFLSIGQPSSREDAMYLQEYILSYDMLDYLDRKLNLRKIYQSSKIDFISRLDKDATKEEFLKYYKKHVDVLFDEFSGILTIKVFAYTAEDAKKINEAILEQCERYINGVSHKIAKEQLNFIEQELSYANTKMQEAKQKLLKFQNTYKVLDPTQEAQAVATLIGQLESQLAAKEAELKTQLTYMREDSFQIEALKGQIKALREQIEKEKARLVGGENSKLNKIMLDYLNYKLEADFLTDVYKTILSAMEATRVDASRKLKNVVVISSPNLPEEALYPKRGYNIILASIILLMVYGIISLILGIIKEHRI